MKEIKLEIGKFTTLKTQYGYNINIVRINKGYYMAVGKKNYGPYLKVMIDKSDKHANDIFIACGSLDNTTIYRAGIYGIETAEIIDTTKQASKIFNKVLDLQPKAKEIEGCALLGVEKGYAAYVDENNKFFLVRIDDSVKPVDENKRFDTYRDMITYYRENGIKVYNEKYEKLSKDTLFVDVVALENFLRDITFEQLPKRIQSDIEIGCVFTESDFDHDFMLKEMYEAEKCKIVKNVYINNNPEYEKQLNEQGYYSNGSVKTANNLNVLKRRNGEIYNRLYATFENRYYELLAKYPDKNIHCLNFSKKIFENIYKYIDSKFHYFQSEVFDEAEFDRILLKAAYMVNEYKDILPYGLRQRVNSKWLKAINPAVYDELWEFCEKCFNEQKNLKR